MSGTAVGAISEFLQPPLQQPTLPTPLHLPHYACPAFPSLLPYLGRCLSILAWENASLELI